MQPATATSKLFIFKAMSPEESNQELLKNKKSSNFAWLLRESREPGMLTVSFSLFSHNININARYACTKRGWICTSDENGNVKNPLPPMLFLNRKSSDKYAIQLIQNITSRTLSIEIPNENFSIQKLRIRLHVNDLIFPTPEMQSTNETYHSYVIIEP